MTCDEARDLLAERLLGTLERNEDDRVAEHLRGCASCRADMDALAEGVGSFARASHDRQPPDDLRDRVLSVLADEWAARPEGASAPQRRAWSRVLAAAALIVALAWAAAATVIAQRHSDAADKYESFLRVLGGENVRVGELHAERSQSVEGSVVVYDSNVGQSWVLVLSRAPGWTGTANVTMRSSSGATIDLHPMDFGDGGEASTWLVTSSDITRFDRVNVWDDDGLIASARIERG